MQENAEENAEASSDVYDYCLKNSGPVKARPSDFDFAVHEISNNGEVTEELEELPAGWAVRWSCSASGDSPGWARPPRAARARRPARRSYTRTRQQPPAQATRHHEPRPPRP